MFLHFSSSVSNVFEIFTILTCILYLILLAIENNFTEDLKSAVQLGAIAIFTAWFNFTLLLGKLPSTGIYIQVIDVHAIHIIYHI